MTTDQKEAIAVKKLERKDEKQSSVPISLIEGFNCAGTGKLMIDPYIARNGYSYEKAFIDAELRDRPDSDLAKIFAQGVFCNIALRDAIGDYHKLAKQRKLEIVEEELAAVKSESKMLALQIIKLDAQAEAFFKKLDSRKVKSKRRAWDKCESVNHLEQTAVAQEVDFTDDPVLDLLECPISKEILENPVFCPVDLHTYDEAHVKKLGVSPLNRKSLENCGFIQNLHVVSAITSYKQLKQEKILKISQIQQKIARQKQLLKQKNNFLQTIEFSRSAPVQMPEKASEMFGSTDHSNENEETIWKTALDAKNSFAFVDLLGKTTDNSKLQQLKINGYSLAEYMALYSSSWPVSSSENMPSKKTLLDELSKRGVKLPALFKTAVFGLSKNANTLLMQGSDQYSGTGYHFLVYAAANGQEKFIAELGKNKKVQIKLNDDDKAKIQAFQQRYAVQKPKQPTPGQSAYAAPSKPVDIKKPDNSSSHPLSTTRTKWLLHAAATEDDQDRITALLVSKESPNQVNEEGWTPLHIAARHGCWKVMKVLLDYGANPTAVIRDRQGWAAIHLAAAYGNPMAVCVLVDRGVNPNSRITDEDYAAIHLAAQSGHVEVIKVLIARKANPNQVEGNSAPLHIAANSGHHEAIQVLIDLKAHPNQQSDKDGYLPINIATAEGNLKAVEVLIAGGANLSLADKRGKTSVHIAAQNGNVGLIELLIDKKADPNQGKWLPLHMAMEMVASKHIRFETIRTLLECKGNPQPAQTAKEIPSPLHFAAQYGFADIIELLIAHNADPNHVMDGYGTPLLVAVANERFEAVIALLARGATPNPDPKLAPGERTPLYKAVERKHVDIVKALIAKNADPNQVIGQGSAPLHRSLKHMELELIQALITAKADVNQKLVGDWTPLHIIAAEEAHARHPQVIALLLEAKADPLLTRKEKIPCENVQPGLEKRLLKVAAERKIFELMIDAGRDFSGRPVGSLVEPSVRPDPSIVIKKWDKYYRFVAKHGLSLKADSKECQQLFKQVLEGGQLEQIAWLVEKIPASSGLLKSQAKEIVEPSIAKKVWSFLLMLNPATSSIDCIPAAMPASLAAPVVTYPVSPPAALSDQKALAVTDSQLTQAALVGRSMAKTLRTTGSDADSPPSTVLDNSESPPDNSPQPAL